jgi:hypothetical protein
VGLVRFDEHLRHVVRPSTHAQQWKTICHELSLGPGPAKTSLRRVLDELADRLPRRMMIILLSDLFDEPGEVVKGFRHLRYRRHELIVWNFWDHAELTFPFQAPTRFEGLEASGRVLSDPRALQTRYLEEVERFLSGLRAACARMQVDWSLFDTSAPLWIPAGEPQRSVAAGRPRGGAAAVEAGKGGWGL